MGQGFEDSGGSLILVGRPGIYDKFFYRVDRNHGFIVGFTEIPEEFSSLYPIVDFVVDDELRDYVSLYEKIVIDDWLRIPPMTFGVVSFFSREGGHYIDDLLSKYLSMGFKMWTTQWYGWKVVGVSAEESLLYDFVMSYSRVFPSRYRPEVINGRFLVGRWPSIINYYCFNDRLDPIRFKGNVLGSDSINGDILAPPNILDIGPRDGREEVYKHFLIDFSDLQSLYVGEPPRSMANKILSVYNEVFRDLLRGFNVVVPYFIPFKDGLSVLYLKYGGGWRADYNPIFEGDGYVIDPFGLYRGSKLRVYYGLWGRVVKRKGLSLIYYMNFREYPAVASRMFYEVRYGGKVIYSSSSKIGVL